MTTLGRLQPGSPVNLEVDVIAKYVESLLAAGPPVRAERGSQLMSEENMPGEPVRDETSAR